MKTLYYNGNVYTGEGFAEAFVVQDGRFASIGRNEVLLLNQYDEKVNLTIDAENMTMTDKTGDTFNFTFDGKTITIVDDGTTMGFDKK